MYGPDVAILLIYGSHDMRHVGFRRLTVVNGTPREMGSHSKHVRGNPPENPAAR